METTVYLISQAGDLSGSSPVTIQDNILGVTSFLTHNDREIVLLWSDTRCYGYDYQNLSYYSIYQTTSTQTITNIRLLSFSSEKLTSTTRNNLETTVKHDRPSLLPNRILITLGQLINVEPIYTIVDYQLFELDYNFRRLTTTIPYYYQYSLDNILVENLSVNHVSTHKLSISGILNNLSSNIIRYSNLNKENKLLIQENLILKSDLIKNKNIEAIKSKKEIYFPFSLINARIVKNNYNKKENFVIINKGEKDGVKKEMGVITSNGIVGIINNVSKNYSSIISIINSNIKINAKIKNTNYFGAIGWSEKKINIMTLEDIVSTAKISIGDTIISGGMSSYFPSNLEIGKIVTLKKEKNEGYYSIEVELFNNPSQWEYVYVIKNMDIMEINNLEKKN